MTDDIDEKLIADQVASLLRTQFGENYVLIGCLDRLAMCFEHHPDLADWIADMATYREKFAQAWSEIKAHMDVRAAERAVKSVCA